MSGILLALVILLLVLAIMGGVEHHWPKVAKMLWTGFAATLFLLVMLAGVALGIRNWPTSSRVFGIGVFALVMTAAILHAAQAWPKFGIVIEAVFVLIIAFVLFPVFVVGGLIVMPFIILEKIFGRSPDPSMYDDAQYPTRSRPPGMWGL